MLHPRWEAVACCGCMTWCWKSSIEVIGGFTHVAKCRDMSRKLNCDIISPKMSQFDRHGKRMTSPTAAKALQLILGASARHAVSMEAIEQALPGTPNRRTLQRWLAEWIAQGLLKKSGRGRATRYLAATAVASTSGTATNDTRETLIPLSVQGQWIDHHVRQPLALRTPVGYQRAFLDRYQPNTTFYLPLQVRQELLACGLAAPVASPAGTYARQIAHRLLIDLAWNSSRLEGNTYSLLETERLLSAGAAADGKNAAEAQMIVNHKEAIEFLITSAEDIGFNRYTVLNLHALLSDNLLIDPTASGRLRSIPVGISQTVFHPLEGPQRIEECFQQILDTAAAIEDPFEQAFFAMVQLPYLQPFEDLNKRVSRLAANIPLIQRNLCPLSFVDVLQQVYTSAVIGVYELNQVDLLRDLFVWAYKRSCARYSAVQQSLGEPDPFRLKYRALLVEVVSQTVRAGLNKADAVDFVRQQASAQVPVDDRAKFVEVAETELMSLHEGNMARYRLRPSEFVAWKRGWQ